MRYLSFTILFLISMFSCNLENISIGTSNASGTIDEVIIIMEESNWKSALGDTARYFFQQPYEMLPQYEPVFDINYLRPEGFKDLLKVVRNVIIIGEIKKDRTTKLALEIFGKDNIDLDRNIAVKNNVFVTGQRITYLYGRNNKELIAFIEKNNKNLINKVAENEKKKIKATVFQGGEDVPITKKIENKFNIKFKVPKGYRFVKENENSIWIRTDSKKYNGNIFIHTIDGIQNENYGVVVRDRIGKQFVEGSTAGSYMQTETKIDYLQETKTKNADEIIISKGLWILTKDFLGGPFVNYKYYDPKNNRTIVVDAFVKAVGSKKRQSMRELEYLINSIRF